MKRPLTILLLCLMAATSLANDAAFLASGNHLIPIHESQVRVQKEILKLNFVNGRVLIDVYYEFFNPGNDKDILVGFEAAPPYPFSLDDIKPNRHHPNIFDFSVVMNGTRLPYDVAMVPLSYYDESPNSPDPFYLKDGAINALSQHQIDSTIQNYEYITDDSPFFYVYHFNAHFKKGLNIVRHTYSYIPSSSVEYSHTITYILTAANRWANKQIDDFTLEIDMGECQSFAITPTFFKNVRDWQIRGKCRTSSIQVYSFDGDKIYAPYFHMQKGSLRFKAKNFHPDGELDINVPIQHLFFSSSAAEIVDDIRSRYYDLDLGFETPQQFQEWLDEKKSDGLLQASALHKKILRNLPFAKRGYIFKTKALQQFYESTDWYLPNPAYKAEPEKLPQAEQIWINFFTD